MQDKTNYLEEVLNTMDGKPVPVPSSWGGYRLLPVSFDFVDISVSYSRRLFYELDTKGVESPTKSLKERQPWKLSEKMP